MGAVVLSMCITKSQEERPSFDLFRTWFSGGISDKLDQKRNSTYIQMTQSRWQIYGDECAIHYLNTVRTSSERTTLTPLLPSPVETMCSVSIPEFFWSTQKNRLEPCVYQFFSPQIVFYLRRKILEESKIGRDGKTRILQRLYETSLSRCFPLLQRIFITSLNCGGTANLRRGPAQ